MKAVFNNKIIGFKCLLVPGLIVLSQGLIAQVIDTSNAGSVSYTSARNIYVKFKSTKAIQVGDTLFTKFMDDWKPVLKVINKSSTSCVCQPLDSLDFKNIGPIYFKKSHLADEITDEKENEIRIPDLNPDVLTKPVKAEKTNSLRTPDKWKGRVSAASYSGFGSNQSSQAHRLQYTLSAQGNDLINGHFSIESYISFRHRLGEWHRVTDNLNDALKIYSLSGSYEIRDKFKISLGRRINHKVSSLGAIDGVQAEWKFNNFEAGAILGSRPDLKDYGFNFIYPEAGVFIHYNWNVDQKIISQQTLSLMEQRRNGSIDRRFMYFQHSSTLFRNLSLFCSAEYDLYQNIPNESSAIFKLTNIYLMGRYRFSRRLNMSLSYDARSNIIYYETYKNDIDRLLEDETRQGLRLQFQIQPAKFINISLGSNYRYQQSGANESLNFNVYASHSRIPILDCALSISGNYLKTNYLVSKVYGIHLSKDYFNGKFFSEGYYRLVNYDYSLYDYNSTQHIGGISINMRLGKKHTLGVYAEETFDKLGNYLRLNARAMYRF